MIEEQAIVVGVKGEQVEIQMQRQGSCNHCELNTGCGIGAIGRMLGHRNKPILIDNTLNMKPGDHILLGMPDRSFLKASLLLYGLPLGLLVVIAVVLEAVFEASEELVLTGAVAGFAGGLFIAARLARRHFSGQLNPRILQINSEPTDQF